MAAKAAFKKKQEEEYDYDQYGFYLPLSKISMQSDKKELKKVNARVEKWRKMLPNIEQLIQSKNEKLKTRIRKGIPDGIRLKVWPHLGQIEALKKKYINQGYNYLIKQADFPYETDIDADLNRTFPNHQLFRDQKNTGIESLKNVLKAVSLTHEDMGYCQGLNFIAAAFMIYINDEESYYMIISLLENYDCKKMYEDVASIRKQLFVHDHLVKKFLPDISEHFQNYGIESITFGTSWYMTLFSSVLPFQYFLRIMDIFFFEKWKIVYRVALAMLKLKKKRLLNAKSFEEVFLVLKDFSEYENNIIDQDKFFKIACKDFIFSKTLIVELEQQYDALNPPNENKKKNRPLQARAKESEKLMLEDQQKILEQQQQANINFSQNENIEEKKDQNENIFQIQEQQIENLTKFQVKESSQLKNLKQELQLQHKPSSESNGNLSPSYTNENKEQFTIPKLYE
ncbi:rab-GTPase-TBC domain protein (macronuclear) [Tetrahymena thermophila SB210]|uniref:Rab-GTPase-TBC domain protein n=1 Tax=Tetrahymena thermophila (strain SB210) TaxID=312017 RepID=Q245C4_TETTS|nr:rab-GTPase-TBC domain protein [Tetrahymena thermophila SB210]EAS03440.1 rab-GTPase-TBC domain protein [Tetrahymena thermophila SB210]|eukprot:XP_001023685.1 rab-GTPase-TBC domain protein [Tetrahymena thermophila SB210]